MVHDLKPKNLHMSGLFLWQNPKNPFLGGVFEHYPPNEIFPKKPGSISFLPLRHPKSIRLPTNILTVAKS